MDATARRNCRLRISGRHPLTSTSPSLGGTIPATTRSSVDFPEPFRPRMTRACPAETDFDTGRNSSTSPARTPTELISINGEIPDTSPALALLPDANTGVPPEKQTLHCVLSDGKLEHTRPIRLEVIRRSMTQIRVPPTRAVTHQPPEHLVRPYGQLVSQATVTTLSTRRFQGRPEQAGTHVISDYLHDPLRTHADDSGQTQELSLLPVRCVSSSPSTESTGHPRQDRSLRIALLPCVPGARPTPRKLTTSLTSRR